jgi:hypothetical protein
MQYVGKTTSKFKDRATAHRFSVDKKKSYPDISFTDSEIEVPMFTL